MKKKPPFKWTNALVLNLLASVIPPSKVRAMQLRCQKKLVNQFKKAIPQT